jgi:tRNA (guanine6-N2)-methyltransferase
MARARRQGDATELRPRTVECEVLAGLEPICAAEVHRVLGRNADLRGSGRGGGSRDEPSPGGGAVRFRLEGPLAAALELRTAVAAYLLVRVAGRRPSALLGDTTLFDQVEAVRRLHPPGAFRSFRLSAPGRDSAALRRLREELTERTGLPEDPGDGDLYLRIRRAGQPAGGWEALVRLSPRPLSARAWRTFNLPGALNATIAAAMVELSPPRPSDRVLNLMCGSGTILVERLERGPVALAAGCDLDPEALAGTGANLAAAGLGDTAVLARMDAAALAVQDGAFGVLLADLPYGHRMGSHQANAVLYPAVLAEAARVTRRGGVMVVVTHELRLFERCLREAGRWWSVERSVQVYQKGHHPVIYLLRRRPEGRAQSPNRSTTSSAVTASDSTNKEIDSSRGSDVTGSGRPARMARSTRTKRR